MTAREVELTGGAPWGFRMHGGADQNQPIRISRVNPGRKASLSGIREGDLISSINGRPTRSMSNADAHAMLRSAGSVLRLGLNEDRDVLPRRRSSGKGSEQLKRPSQLIAEVQSGRATPQAPVYATIRPSSSPQNKHPPSSLRSSLNSLPAALNSTPLVKSVSTTEETPKFHPTNPFYSTLSSNHSSPSKLPVPNSKFSSTSDKKYETNDYVDLKSPSFFSKRLDSGPSSLPYTPFNDNENTNGYNGTKSSEKNDYTYSKFEHFNNQSLPNDSKIKNPFDTKRNSDPFEKYLRPQNKINGNFDHDGKTIPSSMSDSNFSSKETRKSSTITEHKISEIEEVKTIKKIILNGCDESSEKEFKTFLSNGESHEPKDFSSTKQSPMKERSDITPTRQRNEHFSKTFDQKENEEKSFATSSIQRHSNLEGNNRAFTGDTPTSEVVTIKPPLHSPTPAPHSPTSKPVWRPGAPTPPPAPGVARSPGAPPPPPPPPVWTPGSAGNSPQTPRKSYRPVQFEETPPTRRKFGNSDQNGGGTSGSESEGRLRTSQSAPVTGLNTLGSNVTSRLPRAQNPTVTLLQKAREGQIPRGANYLQQEKDSARLPRDRPSPPRGDPVHALRREYASETEGERSDCERGGARKMADAPKKVEGIGPTTKEGMPVSLRSEVKDPSRWYKKMYDTIHKNKYDDDYVTIRYKSRRGQPPERVTNKSQYAYFDPRSGYLSEPEGGLNRMTSQTWSDAYDSDVTTGPRRRTASVQEERRMTEMTSSYMSNNKYSTLASGRASQEVYKGQPGRIEDYVPGKSSVVDKEAKQWWDEVMDIFDGWLDDNSPLPPYTTLLARAIQKSQNNSSTTSLPQASPKEKKDLTSTILSKSNMARALKESGYESDSTLVFRRREETDGPLSPAERRAAYRDLQAGGEPPLRGFRSPAPPRQDETEIEYIPISPTLTKIRVHKKTPQLHEVICYPVTRIETDAGKFRKQAPSFLNLCLDKTENPPAPPRRISSKNSRTLKLVTNTRPVSMSPKRTTKVSQSNVDFLKDKISHKLQRQNTHIISKPSSISDIHKSKSRIMSVSAPPAINRKSNINTTPKTIKISQNVNKPGCTSSFGSPRRTLLPVEYSNSAHTKYGEQSSSVPIEGGAGRRTPITNILDKVTKLDKLWSAEKRNERIDLSKARSISKSAHNIANKTSVSKSPDINSRASSSSITHRSRDMIRTAEKVQKLKVSSVHTKSNPCLANKNETKNNKTNLLSSTSSISKSSMNLTASFNKKPNQIKTATVTNLKKKKSLDSIVIRPRSVPCHEACSKKAKETNKNGNKKSSKIKSSKKASIKSSNGSESGSQFGESSNDLSNIGSSENLEGTKITSKDIKRSHDAVVTDSFFQHLFLGKSYTPHITTYPIQEHNTTVLQKAKMFQSLPQDISAPKSLNSYLIHRKPVSLSRFKIWDRYPSPVSVQSSRSISWPSRIHNDIRKFDSFSKCDEFGSTSSLATIRSKSEPPINKMYFSQTTRPKSPTVIFYGREKSKSPTPSATSPTRLIFSQTSRPVSPKVVHKVKKQTVQSNKRQSLSPTKIIFTETMRPISPTIDRRRTRPENKTENKFLEEKNSPTLFFSQTSRPVSPKVTKKSASTTSLSRSQSTSPVSIRSPSYRRIHNVRQQNGKTEKYSFRTRSAGDADKKINKHTMSTKTQSESNLHVDDPEYDEYMQDMQDSKVRSERFRELNRYYAYLERVGELEKATSTCDLRHRRKDEEIIDFERWKKIRSIERAEQELNNLYRKLKIAQTEKDVLFYPRDVKDFRWNYDSDRGLRIKEKSVEDLKEHFQQKSQYDSLELDQPTLKDTYKPLWRGTSVAETAFYINRKNDHDINDHSLTKPTVTLQKEAPLSELRKKIGLGSRLWSSLSMEQVNALKNQLNAIYSKELESKSNKDNEKYTIDVKQSDYVEIPKLQVRCNSLIASDYSSEKDNFVKLSKSDSIAAIPCPITTVKDLKNNVNKIQMSLSENEKRKISQTLSKEVLDRMNKFDNPPPLTLKQELELCEAIENKNHGLPDNSSFASKKSFEQDNNNNNTKNNAESDNNDLHKQISLNDKSEIQCQSSASETETASSDHSNKTVIYRGPERQSKEVLKKVEYFESVRNRSEQAKVVYHARENSDEKDKFPALKNNLQSTETKEPESPKSQIVQSQSCANFRELFGESERNKFLSLPCKPDQRSRSGSPQSDINITERRTPDTLRSSDETIWRSRSPSPEPERYWRAYLNLARAGEVRRIARRFDSPTAAGAVLRRHRSDPEIARNVLTKNWSTFERLSTRRDKSRAMLPVARVPLRPANRYMPHIDIISKLAALRRRTIPRSRSAEEATECRAGEVDRIRRRFETMSLLGQIYASAPDVSELHDIAPYLAGSWIAHRYPKRSDNNRSLKDPSTFVRGRTSPVRKETKRIVAKDGIKLSSILKNDSFDKQEFDPSLHRPVERYEPPRAPPRPPPASWPYKLAPHVMPSRHTVTFQENDPAPEPPRRTSYGSYSDTDDGFFSDVPGSGSLSRSLHALNKYMKKNLLFEDATDNDVNDRAYFSKESTPNESVTKYDSEDTRSNASLDKEAVNAVKFDEAKTECKVNLSTTVPTNITNNNVQEINQTNEEQPITNPNIIVKKSIIRIQYSDSREEPPKRILTKSHSVEDLQTDGGTPIDEDDDAKQASIVKTRTEKPANNKDENRHTLHDFSEWVNRTDRYPDVYAPLPYKSPRRYVESDVNIHYRVPVRHDPLPLVPERELARQQAEHMKRLYREQRRNKYLQELQDMQNRRHQDNFTPSQKNILPLNRYDEAERIIAKALYTFNGQTSRELSFRKGEIIHVRRQIDANWYEGEIHGRIGLFPYNYVEIQKGDSAAKKPALVEGRARAKFDFTAQTNLELPLKKGEVVVLTRRIDQNWWEGRNGGKTGIFPDSYITVLQEPSQNKPELPPMHAGDKPAASPAAHGVVNGAAARSLSAHAYTPQHNSPALANAPPATQPLRGYVTKGDSGVRGYGPPSGAGVDLNNTEPLYVDTNAEAVPYRAMYKYRPQNPDELELNEGETVYVLEKCDDGWYVGSSQRTGRFGTFPGNYVERI